MEDREIRFERAAYLGLVLPSHAVALVKSSSGRSTRLPTLCDVCQKAISVYPFITKNANSGHRRYHIACALRVGLVSPIPTNA